MTIYFYSTKDEYGFFSNFYPCTIKYKGSIYSTTEHAFQAAKFEDKQYQELIKKANTPKEAARLGRDRKGPKLRKDWESIKYNIMKDIVRIKFLTHEDLKQKLLDTGNEKIVEHTSNDGTWGDFGDGSGLNWLGIILMEIREELRT